MRSWGCVALLVAVFAFAVATGAASGRQQDQPSAGGLRIEARDAIRAPRRSPASDAWTRILGCTCVAADVATAADGSVYVAGTSASAFAGQRQRGLDDMLLARFDASGKLIWGRLVGDSNYDFGEAVAIGPDGSVYLVGSTYRLGTISIAVVKYTREGVKEWVRFIAGDSDFGIYFTASDAATGRDGGLYITGSREWLYLDGRAGVQGMDYVNDLVVAKMLPNGKQAWVHRIGGEAFVRDFYGDTIATYEGAVYVVGRDGGNLLLAKLAPGGGFAWTKTLDAKAGNSGAGIVGSGDSLFLLSNLGESLVLSKYSLEGDPAWSRPFPGGASVTGQSIVAASDGSLWLLGNTNSPRVGSQVNHGKWDILLAHYNPSGKLLGVRLRGGAGDDLAGGIASARGGLLYFAGTTKSEKVDGASNPDKTKDIVLFKMVSAAPRP